MIERRGGSDRGVGLFANHSCDAGTALVVVPNARTVTSASLSTLGCKYAFNVPGPDIGEVTVGMPPNWMGPGLPPLTSTANLLSPGWLGDSSGVVSSLLGCTRGQWVELAWRLSLEECCAHTYWWGWCDSLPSHEEFAADLGRVDRHLRIHTPHLVGAFSRLKRAIEREVEDAFARLSATCAVPPMAIFQWAVRVVMSRGLSLVAGPNLTSSGASPVCLGICPVIDLVNGSGSSFSVVYNTRQPDYLDDILSKEIALESRRSVHLCAASTRASQTTLTLPNCDIEVASHPCELPPWYRRDHLMLPSALCRSDNSEEDFDRAADLGTLTTHRSEALFPAVVLTTSKAVGAGEELLRHYDVSPQTWWCGSPDTGSCDLRDRLATPLDEGLLLARDCHVSDRGDALALGMMLRYAFSNY